VTAVAGVSPRDVFALVRELRTASADERPIVLSGPPGLVAALGRELTRDGVASAVREGGGVEGAAALVLVLVAEATADEVALLRAAERARIPSVAVITSAGGDRTPDPAYVLPGNIVHVPSGSGFPVDEIARRLAGELGDRGTALAARLPVLRGHVVDHLIRRYARQNAILGASGSLTRASMPLLTLNQVRLLLRIADAYGYEIDRERVPEVLGVVAGGVGLRAVARRTVGWMPIAGWAVRAGVAYGGTRAIGEAAKRYFEKRAPVTRVAGSRALFPRRS
jgi:uncharacterized protein (DUF697 family)